MAQAQRVEFLKVSVTEQPGALLGILQNLKGKNISLKALWGFSKTEGTAEVYCIAKDNGKLQDVLNALGLQAEKGTAFFMKGTDKAGVLVKSLEALSNASINIKGIHAIAASGKYGSIVLVNAADVENAAKALGAK